MTLSKINISLEPDNLKVSPGETVSTSLTVQNVSNVIEIYSFRLGGLDESWYQLGTSSANLGPTQTTDCKIDISPPRNSTAVAQNYSFWVRVASQRDSSIVAVVQGTLEVSPFYSYEMDLQPRKVNGPKGHHTLDIKNESNAQIIFDLDGKDPEGLCSFNFRPETPRISPGDHEEVAVTVDPSEKPLMGSPRSYTYAITAVPDNGVAEPKTVPGELNVPVTIKRWHLIAAAAALVVVVLAVVIPVVFLSGTPLPELNLSFVVPPDDGRNVRFNLPNLRPTRLELDANWRGNAETLQFALISPDDTQLTEFVEVSAQKPKLRFDITNSDLTHGAEGWRIRVNNISKTGQADLDLKVTFEKLE